jgi:DNA-binding GntR family transcriptional regulator
LTDQVYAAIRDRILAGDVAPGEFVREQEVSQAMGVSRTPVRGALGRLASEGFLDWTHSVEEHEEILSAIQNKAFDEAIEILLRNRLTTQHRFDARMGASGAPSD